MITQNNTIHYSRAIKRNCVRILQRNSNVNSSKANVKLSDKQLKKLKTVVKNKTGMTLKMSLKIFDENNLLQELLLTTRQRTKLRNTFNNKMSIDLKLSKVQISKIIQSGGILGPLLTKLAGKVAIPL